MYKVHPVLDDIVEKFKEMYEPGQNMWIDDSMMTLAQGTASTCGLM